MANNKTINTRIRLKYDSYANWEANNPLLLEGEVAIAKLTTTHAVNPGETDTQAPVLFKVGPGNFKDLPWVSGLAADVYAWAKKATPDWNDFPTLPLTVEDNGTGKFITDFTFANNTLTITRSDVAWEDVTNKPNLVNTVAADDASLTVAPNSGDVKVKVNVSADANNTLELKADGLYVAPPAEVTLPSVTDNAVALSFVTEVDQNSGEVSTSKAALVAGENVTLTQNAAGADITISGKSWQGEINNALEAAKKYADDNDANTAHTHSAGTGTVVTANGGIDGNVAVNLNVELELDDNKNLVLKDKTSKEIIASMSAADFIKDGMLNDVEYNAATNTLTFTWNTDAGETQDTVVLSDILDPYVAVDTTTIDMDITGTEISAAVKAASLDNTHLAAAAGIKKTQLESDVQTSLGKADSAVQTVIEGTANGTIAVDGANVAVHGLGSAAYTDSTTYATAQQGAKADTAIQTLVSTYGPGGIDVGVIPDAEGNNVWNITLSPNTVTEIQGKATHEEVNNAIGYIIESLDSSVSAATEDNNQVSVLTGVTQTDGVLSDHSEVKLAAIAKTGNINDLIQDTNDYVIFNCGTSTTVI